MLGFYHPITKEREDLKNIADKIRAIKAEIKYQGHLFSLLGDRELRPFINKSLIKSPQELAKLQQSRDRLRKVYRHRHVAVCLVQQGITGIHLHNTKGSIETKNTSTKLNMEVVNMHRMRILTNIAKAYSDYTDKLVKQIPREEPEIIVEVTDPDLGKPMSEFDMLMDGFDWIDEAAPVSRDAWDNIKVPICEFVPDKGKSKILYIEDFEQGTGGDMVYNVKEAGTLYCQREHYKVLEGCTANLEKSELKYLRELENLIKKGLTDK